jgi:hypothetical protein
MGGGNHTYIRPVAGASCCEKTEKEDSKDLVEREIQYRECCQGYLNSFA